MSSLRRWGHSSPVISDSLPWLFEYRGFLLAMLVGLKSCSERDPLPLPLELEHDLLSARICSSGACVISPSLLSSNTFSTSSLRAC